jgi:hypothetical protein
MKLIHLIVTLPMLLALSSCGHSDSPEESRRSSVTDDAGKLCLAFEKTGLTTACSVNVFDKTIDVTIDTNGTEARKMCVSVVSLLAKQTSSFGFDNKWKLQIFSPYSGKKAIASCPIY